MSSVDCGRLNILVQVVYNIILAVTLLVSIVYTVIVLLTGKGDAMSGGGSGVRTTFKGKAGFDDMISKLCLYLGGAFMALTLILDVIATQLARKG